MLGNAGFLLVLSFLQITCVAQASCPIKQMLLHMFYCIAQTWLTPIYSLLGPACISTGVEFNYTLHISHTDPSYTKQEMLQETIAWCSLYLYNTLNNTALKCFTSTGCINQGRPRRDLPIRFFLFSKITLALSGFPGILLFTGIRIHKKYQFLLFILTK